MSQETTDAGLLGDWQRLLNQMKVNQGELAHLEVPRAQLEALLSRALEIHQEQAARTAAKQELSRQFRAAVNDGRRVATLLRQALRVHYGIQAEKLAEFGVQPFRGRTRKAKPAPEGPAAPGTSTPPPITPPEAPLDPRP